MLVTGISAEENLQTSSYLVMISQTQSFSGNLNDFNLSSSWKEEAMHATSLTLLAKLLAPRKFNAYLVQTTFDLAANLSFGVKVSIVDRANNNFRLKFPHEADCNKIWKIIIWHVKVHC